MQDDIISKQYIYLKVQQLILLDLASNKFSWFHWSLDLILI